MERQHITAIASALFLIFAFFLSFFPNEGSTFLLKLVFLIASIGTLYYFFSREFRSPVDGQAEKPFTPEDSPLEMATSTEPELLHIAAEKSVEEHFTDFLVSLFPLVRQTLVCDTVVLLMVNFQKKQFYIRHHQTVLKDIFTRDRYLDLHGGLPALILRSKKPLLEHHLPDSNSLLPYYGAPDVPAKSFAGVPMFFEDTVIGILCADSSVEQSFSREDLHILSQFSNILGIQIACSNKLYEYETENWTIRMLFDFSKEMLRLKAVADLWKLLDTCLVTDFSADRVVLSEEISGQQGKITHVHGSAASLLIDREFPNDEGINGWVLRKRQPILVEDFTQKENYIPRFFLKEEPFSEYKSLLAVPVIQTNDRVLVICIESKKPRAFTEQHKQLLQTMSYQIAAFLDKALMIEQLHAKNLIDPQSNLGNEKALELELQKEIRRSNMNKRPFSLSLLKVRPRNNSHDGGVTEQLANEFVSFSLPLFESSNYIFKLSVDTFACIWPETEIKKMLPGLREISGSIIAKRGWVNGLVDQVFIHHGLVQFPDTAATHSELLIHAREALRKAELKGVNNYEIYSSGIKSDHNKNDSIETP